MVAIAVIWCTYPITDFLILFKIQTDFPTNNINNISCRICKSTELCIFIIYPDYTLGCVIPNSYSIHFTITLYHIFLKFGIKRCFLFLLNLSTSRLLKMKLILINYYDPCSVYVLTSLIIIISNELLYSNNIFEHVSLSILLWMLQFLSIHFICISIQFVFMLYNLYSVLFAILYRYTT